MSKLYNFFTRARQVLGNPVNFLCAVLLSGFFCAPNVLGQISVPNTTTINETFDGMGATPTATLPTNWKMSPAGGGLTSTWSNVSNFTSVSQGASSGTPTTGGRYNLGNGTNTSDRSLGVMTSGSYASPNSIMAHFRNTNVQNIQSLTVGYTLERYRINTALASVSFSYSLDGTNWTAVPSGDIVSSSLPTGTSLWATSFNPSGVPSPANPGIVTLSTISITSLSIPTNGDFYLRWNLVTTGGNSQAIAVDNFSLSATFGALTPTINVTGSFSKFYANQGIGSEVQSVSVSGSNLTNNITIGPLTGYEFSTLSTGPFSSSLTLPQVSGTVASTTVFARVTSSASVGTLSGNVDFVSSPASTVQRSVTGQVYSNGVAFTTGNILTLRVGEVGGTALTTNSAPVFIDEYTTSGTFVQSVSMPFVTNGAQRKFTMSGTSTTEGFLNLSPDGQYLTFGGYDAIPGVSNISTTSASSTNRIVARVMQNGTINTTTRISDGYDGNSIRSAATSDGTSFWTGGAGTGGGTRYVTLGASTSTQVSTTTVNTRGTAIYNSQLYSSAQSGNIGISTVGSGLPTTTGNTHVILGGTTSSVELLDPRGFVFADVDDNGTPDVMYVADASTNVNQGIVKFSNTGGVWTKRGNLPNPTGRAVHGIGVQVVGGNRVLYICLGTTTAPANEIYKFTDNSSVTANITNSGTDIITACGAPIITTPNASQVLFKGVSFAPVNVPTPTINHTFTTPVSTVDQGTSQPIYSVKLDITDGNALLTGFTTQTGGVYLGSDFTSFKLVISTNSTYEITDPVLSTISTSTGPGQTLAFTGLGQNLPVGTTRYLFVVASASGCASIGNTIEITSTPLTNITYSNTLAVKNGTPTAGTSVTTTVGVLDNVASFTAVGGQPTVQLSWNNPSCVSEVVIVAHTSPINDIPLGTYTGNTNYLGGGSSFPGGGKVVYVGLTSPQTITGLTLNQLYYFKAFVKLNSNYSSGVQVTATPTIVNIYSRGSGNSHSDPIWSLSPNGIPQTLTAIGGMSSSRGLVIQSGHIVNLSQSGGSVVCRELIVESGATFKTNLVTNTYLTVFGDVTNNGVIGTGGVTVNNISLNVEGSVINFKGNGTTDFNIIRKNTNTNTQTTLSIQSNVNVRSTGTGLFNNTANTKLNTIINSGKTLNVVGDVALDGVNGTDASERAGNIINSGNFYVGGTLFLVNNNTTPGYGCGFSTGSNSYTQVGNLFTDLNLGQGTNVNLSSQSKVDVFGTLTITSGTLSSNGAIVLKSNGSSTARIANSTGSISGLITSERNVSNSGWHFTGTVFSGQTISDWRDDLPGSETQGPMPGVHTPNTGYYTSMIFGYDQDNNAVIPYVGSTTNGWIVPQTSSIDQYKGYRVFIKSGRVLDNAGIYNMNPDPINLNYNPSSNFAGWNLVMNPHLSAINTSGFIWGSSVQQVVVIWNPLTNQYQYQGTLGGLTGVTFNNSISPIASGQSFFVKCTSPSTLGIPQSAKSTNSGTFFRTSTYPNVPNALEIRIKNKLDKYDATLFQFIEGSKVGYEVEMDASKIMNPDLNIYTITTDDILAINAMPFENEQVVVKLGFTTENSGLHGIQFDGLNILNVTTDLYLKDNLNNTIQLINSLDTYNFFSETGKFDDRFELIFSNSITSIDKFMNKGGLSIYPNPVEGKDFTLSIGDYKENITIEIIDLMGKTIFNKKLDSYTNLINIPKPNTSGKYIVKVRTSDSVFLKSILVN